MTLSKVDPKKFEILTSAPGFMIVRWYAHTNSESDDFIYVLDFAQQTAYPFKGYSDAHKLFAQLVEASRDRGKVEII